MALFGVIMAVWSDHGSVWSDHGGLSLGGRPGITDAVKGCMAVFME